MPRLRLASVVLLACGLLGGCAPSPAPPVAAASAPCAEPEVSGCTSGSIEDDDAVLRGKGGSGGDVPAQRPRDPGGDGDADDAAACQGGRCDPWIAPRDGYDVVLVTLSDIARFRPSASRQAMEPDGWAVVGLPANIHTRAQEQVVAGTLLGSPAEVRFTPVGYRWNYGDGATAAHRTSGGTWASLGLREFDPTPTSHVFSQVGTFTVRLDVVYRAEYRIDDGPFVPISGTLAVAAEQLVVNAGDATTVLVDRDCAPHRTAPGC